MYIFAFYNITFMYVASIHTQFHSRKLSFQLANYAGTLLSRSAFSHNYLACFILIGLFYLTLFRPLCFVSVLYICINMCLVVNKVK